VEVVSAGIWRARDTDKPADAGAQPGTRSYPRAFRNPLAGVWDLDGSDRLASNTTLGHYLFGRQLDSLSLPRSNERLCPPSTVSAPDMPQSVLRLIKRAAEFIPKDHLAKLPRGRRGVYVLYRRRVQSGKEKFDVVYVGMAAAGRRGGIRGRLASHAKKKAELWTHFSAFEVWDNISDAEVTELEGLFRHIYRKDSKANRLNVQRDFVDESDSLVVGGRQPRACLRG
jgi:hypothetical protein